ncbi:histidinol-phosphate aminotransferase [Clostridium botulinum B str. Osaka05]|uniref:Histidinol-phosphate aminotransferase n=2 Tax=Clostridium TaxID=1485 RepID=A0A0S6U4G7_CLOBO|nr:histidinol-phosphate transaminase [Clostridium botulinum]GAE02116.1 histidinol-phosphate aminotransferase [Clostridium botulinum B str. Osaka05]
MSKYWSNITKNIEPYVCGEQPKNKKIIKLNTNENPYSPSPKVFQAIKNAAKDDLRLYPDANCDALRKTIADYYNLSKEEVFIGNGSDEVLAFSFLTFFNPQETIVFSDISYSFYSVYANLYKLNYKLAKLREDFSIDINDFKNAEGGAVITNPNAPTGLYLSLDSIEQILDDNVNKVVIVDEAYIDFGGKSSVSLIKDYPNLLVIQTLSKSRSLAGMRVGFALGQRHLIDGLYRIKNSFNSYTIDRISSLAAIEAIKDKEYFKECISKIIKTRNWTINELEKMGFKIIPSKANFIFITHDTYQAEDIFIKLKDENVLVRYFNKDRISNYLRVSIGSKEEMDIFIDKIKKILNKL